MDYTKTLTRIAELSAQTGSEQANIERIVSEAAGLFNAGMASAFRIGQQGNLRHLAGLGLPLHTARKLEEAGYISCSKFFEGRLPKTQYKLTAAGRSALENYLSHMESLIKQMRKG